jgi:hypothetical protein
MSAHSHPQTQGRFAPCSATRVGSLTLLPSSAAWPGCLQHAWRPSLSSQCSVGTPSHPLAGRSMSDPGSLDGSYEGSDRTGPVDSHPGRASAHQQRQSICQGQDYPMFGVASPNGSYKISAHGQPVGSRPGHAIVQAAISAS